MLKTIIFLFLLTTQFYFLYPQLIEDNSGYDYINKIVIVFKANIREEPLPDANIISVLDKGDIVKVKNNEKHKGPHT